MLQLAQHHRPVLHLVVELEALDEVLVGAGVLGLFHLVVNGEELKHRERVSVYVLVLHVGRRIFVQEMVSREFWPTVFFSSNNYDFSMILHDEKITFCQTSPPFRQHAETLLMLLSTLSEHGYHVSYMFEK